MIRLPPGSTRTHSLLPYTTLCRSGQPFGCPGSLGALQLLRGGAGRRELLGRDAYVAPSLLDPSLQDRGHRLQMLGVACHVVRTVKVIVAGDQVADGIEDTGRLVDPGGGVSRLLGGCGADRKSPRLNSSH